MHATVQLHLEGRRTSEDFDHVQAAFTGAMPIKISRTLIAKLPDSERADIKEFLQTKAGGSCFLCGEQISEASDSLVVDHDRPESEGGTTTRTNLNLVHQS